MIKGIDHVGIVVSDLNRSIDFYKNVLGLEVGEKWEFESGATLGPSMRLPRKVVFIKVDSSRFELLDHAENMKVKPEGLTSATVGINHIAFAVEEIHGYVSALQKKGIRLSTGPVDIKNLTVAFFEDPDGNMLELSEARKPSSNSKKD
ncbi:MAG: VOC family protein [Spirochaetia bacterium]|jgi:glyoxylase I family protein